MKYYLKKQNQDWADIGHLESACTEIVYALVDMVQGEPYDAWLNETLGDVELFGVKYKAAEFLEGTGYSFFFKMWSGVETYDTLKIRYVLQKQGEEIRQILMSMTSGETITFNGLNIFALPDDKVCLHLITDPFK